MSDNRPGTIRQQSDGRMLSMNHKRKLTCLLNTYFCLLCARNMETSGRNECDLAVIPVASSSLCVSSYLERQLSVSVGSGFNMNSDMWLPSKKKKDAIAGYMSPVQGKQWLGKS